MLWLVGVGRKSATNAIKKEWAQLMDVFRCLLKRGDRWVRRVPLMKLISLFLCL
jgi:hypothetical protein